MTFFSVLISFCLRADVENFPRTWLNFRRSLSCCFWMLSLLKREQWSLPEIHNKPQLFVSKIISSSREEQLLPRSIRLKRSDDDDVNNSNVN